MDEPKKPFRESNLAKEILEKISKAKQILKDQLSNISSKDADSEYRGNSRAKKLLAGFMIVVILGLGYTGYAVNEIRTRAFDIYLGGEKLGSIRTEEEAKDLFNEVREDLCQEYNLEIVFEDDISFEETHAKDDDLVNPEALKDGIKSNVGVLVAGYAVTVDGEEIGVFKSEEEAKSLIDEVKKPYLSKLTEGNEAREVNLIEDVQIVEKETSLNSLSNKEKVLDYIVNGGEEVRTHIVEVGESFWTIAKMYDISVEELELANEDRDPTMLKPGDEVQLVLAKSLITVETIEEVEYTEEIKYETTVELNDSMYKNEQKIKVEGIKGESKVVAYEVRHNGIVVDKEIIDQEVIKDATDEVVVKGTKERPKTVATGSFSTPTRGRITSRYGMRWGRMHRGLDFAASHGTAIKAADGGTVSYAGYRGAYGYMVEINHGNGYTTRYAHCSKMLVKAGTKVAKGQHIANVGNSGRSTGPHLHFEVLKNGTHQNPSNYLK